MDVTEDSTGSGSNELMALRVATVDKFTISNVGAVQSQMELVQAENAGIVLALTDAGKTITIDAAGAQGVTLPSVAAANAGVWYRIVKLGAGNVTITAADADTIADSSAGGTIANTTAAQDYATITLMLANATEWVIIGASGTWTTT